MGVSGFGVVRVADAGAGGGRVGALASLPEPEARGVGKATAARGASTTTDARLGYAKTGCEEVGCEEDRWFMLFFKLQIRVVAGSTSPALCSDMQGCAARCRTPTNHKYTAQRLSLPTFQIFVTDRSSQNPVRALVLSPIDHKFAKLFAGF